MLRCKPDDLAYINRGPNAGCLVKCLHFDPSHVHEDAPGRGCWKIRSVGRQLNTTAWREYTFLGFTWRRHVRKGVPALEGMVPDFALTPIRDPGEQAADEFAARRQSSFPVGQEDAVHC